MWAIRWPGQERVNRGPLTAPSRLDRGDVDFLHTHHRIKRAFCLIATGSQRIGKHARRDLPGDAPFVLAPTARTFLAAIADDCAPVAVGLLLIVSGDLEREGFVMFERGPAIEAETGDAGDCEFDRQYIACLDGWVVYGSTVYGSHRDLM